MAAKARGLRFVKRAYPARVLGLGLGGFAVGAALHPLEPSPLLWVVLFYNTIIWPHLAYFMATRSAFPHLIERRHLIGDAVMGGFWIASMGFNPLASAIVSMMLCMNSIAAGGMKFFVKTVVAAVAGLIAGLLLFGFHWYPFITMTIVYACIPMLIIYPILVGSITYNISLQLHGQKELLMRLSRTDGLTGVFNRSYWEARAREEIVRSRRNQHPLSLIIIDIDHFKRINDTHGHVTGDHVLKQLAQTLQQNLRETEILGRYGGEEFAIILPNTESSIAWNTGERLREIIEKTEFHDDPEQRELKLNCTISLGVAAFSDGAGDFSSWIRAADSALYQAKSAGRNRCIAFICSEPATKERA